MRASTVTTLEIASEAPSNPPLPRIAQRKPSTTPVMGFSAKIRCSLPHGVGKERPRQQAAVAEDGVGYSVGWDPGEVPEDDGEDGHRQQGLKDRPRSPQHRLLVAHLDVAPGQEVEQLAIAPQRLQ